jgi:hypothetical protein
MYCTNYLCKLILISLSVNKYLKAEFDFDASPGSARVNVWTPR